MDPQLRSRFNADFASEKYAALLRCVNETEKCPVDFRVSETPIFLTNEFTNEVTRAATDIVDLHSDHKELLEDFRAYTSTDENSNRVGEFAIGTNTACTRVIGNILQDEKIPGVHIAFGHPYAEHTGANWISKTHIDCVGRDFDIWFDGEQVMQRGKFLV